MKKFIVLFAAILGSVLLLTGCGEKDPLLGKYVATITVYNKVECNPVELAGGDVVMTLDKEGSGDLVVGPGHSTITWSVAEDNTFTVICDGKESKGTRYNDVIVVDEAFGTSMTYVFVKKGADVFESGKVKLPNGTLGDYQIDYLGAEGYTDPEGANAFKLFYNFTNNSDKDMMSNAMIRMQAFQNGKKLQYSKIDEKDPHYAENIRRTLYCRPGVSARCERSWALVDDSKVSVESFVFEGDKYHCYVTEIDPKNFSGGPTDEWLPVKVADPHGADGLKPEGQLGDLTVANTKVHKEGDVIMVNLEVTNSSEEEVILVQNLMPRIFQDGLQLEYVKMDCSYSLQPGEMSSVTYIAQNRTDSPVELELLGGDYKAGLGGIYQL